MKFSWTTSAVILVVCLGHSASGSLVNLLERQVDLAEDGILAKRATSPKTTSTSKAKSSSKPAVTSSLSKTSTTSALPPPPCPTVWTQVAAELRQDFFNCSQKAANAIRFAFHDAATYSSLTPPYGAASGGADGSLLLNATEGNRAEHSPMQSYRRYLLAKYTTYQPQGVGAADLVQFAGNIAVSSCQGGPIIKTVVGRTDDRTAAPAGLLPVSFGAGAAYGVIIKLFAEKGFNARELAALMGAHSVSRAFLEQAHGIPANAPQDSTPEVWDMLYYSQTQAAKPPAGVYRFESDVNLANITTETGLSFREFAQDRAAWVTAFTAAMYKQSLLGIAQSKSDGFIDCTETVRFNATV